MNTRPKLDLVMAAVAIEAMRTALDAWTVEQNRSAQECVALTRQIAEWETKIARAVPLLADETTGAAAYAALRWLIDAQTAFAPSVALTTTRTLGQTLTDALHAAVAAASTEVLVTLPDGRRDYAPRMIAAADLATVRTAAAALRDAIDAL